MPSLTALNQSSEAEFRQAFGRCCGSSAWVEKMIQARPFRDFHHLLQEANQNWNSLTEAEQREVFQHHPKIGEQKAHGWAKGEQSGVAQAQEEVLQGLAQGNQDYFNRFGFIFLICATGKSASEMLQALKTRLTNDKTKEFKIAMAEQMKITELRLRKLLEEKE